MSSEQQAFSASQEKHSPLHSRFQLSSEQGYDGTVTVGKTQPCEDSPHRAYLGLKLTLVFEVSTNEFVQGKNSILSKLSFSQPGANAQKCNVNVHSKIFAAFIGSVQYSC